MIFKRTTHCRILWKYVLYHANNMYANFKLLSSSTLGLLRGRKKNKLNNQIVAFSRVSGLFNVIYNMLPVYNRIIRCVIFSNGIRQTTRRNTAISDSIDLIPYLLFVVYSGKGTRRTAVAQQSRPQSDGTLFVHSVQRCTTGC